MKSWSSKHQNSLCFNSGVILLLLFYSIFTTASAAESWPVEATAMARAECKRILNPLKITWSEVPPMGAPGSCGTAAPIQITQIEGITLTPPALTNCQVAVSLRNWANNSIIPYAKKKLGQSIASLRVAASYVCRRRNNQPNAKISQHSFADAIDISAIYLKGGEEISVQKHWGGNLVQALNLSNRASFLTQIRKDACTHFTTVLGPGSDSYHRDHFHLDLTPRRSNGHYCH